MTNGASDKASPGAGGPFSALAQSMQPQSADINIDNPDHELLRKDPNSQPEFRYDEFGFKVEEEDGPEDRSSKLLSIPFVESPKRRLQWAVELELGQDNDLKDSCRLKALVNEVEVSEMFMLRPVIGHISAILSFHWLII